MGDGKSLYACFANFACTGILPTNVFLLTPFLHYCAHMEILARKLEARAENQKLNNHVQK